MQTIRSLLHLAMAGAVGALACAAPVTTTTPAPATAAPMTAAPAPAVPTVPDNPLLREWVGPYGGVPPFDQIKIEHFEPALETAMQENLAEIDRIANNPQPPTFENTIAALEGTGETLDRVFTAYGVWGSTLNGPEFQ